MKRRTDLKPYELLLIVLGALIFVLSATLYMSDISLRKVILGWKDESGKDPVGRLSQESGVIRRQYVSGSEFQAIPKEAPLYNFDTLVTGPDSSATIQLDDGSKIEMAPNTMVKLTFETQFSLGGISRKAAVEVVSGEVSGQAEKSKIVIRTGDQEITLTKKKQTIVAAPASIKKATGAAAPSTSEIPPPKPVAKAALPVASPSPKPPEVDAANVVEWVTPKYGANLVVDHRGEEPSKKISIEWKCVPTPVHFELVVTQKKTGDEIFNQSVDLTDGHGAVSTVLHSPGLYVAEMRPIEGQAPKNIQTTPLSFNLNPEFEAIEVLPHLVGGKAITSTAYMGSLEQNFDLTLRWKPYAGADQYTVRLTRSLQDKKPLLERKVEGDKYSFNKNKVFAGQVYYTIATQLKRGFIAKSKPQILVFNFLAPLLVSPVDQASLPVKGKAVLFTWQKTNFTEEYELEIASDADFQKILVKQRLKENFFLFRALTDGTYFWHVRSFSKNLVSPPSKVFAFNVAK